MVGFAGTSRRAEIAGKVVAIGRVNLTIETTFRASPTGPWFTQTHKLPIAQATSVLVGDRVVLVVPA